MFKILIFGIVIWLIIFLVRVASIGGIDPSYRDAEVSLFEPLSNYLLAVVDHTLPYPQSALLAGILLGERSDLPYSLKEDLTKTSTIHLVVVSGQNLTMVAGLVMGLAGAWGRKKTIALTGVVIILYAILTGLQLPVIRASLMTGATFLAQILGRAVLGWWVLLLTAATMLLYNPNWVLSVSFQLSFLATLGVVAVSPILQRYLSQVPRLIRQDLAVTFAAQLMVTPIIAANFNRISLVGVLCNTLILFTIPLVMISGFITIAVGIVSPVLGLVVGLVPTALLSYFIDVVEFSASLPLASINVGELGWLTWGGYYLVITGLLWHLNSKLKIKS